MHIASCSFGKDSLASIILAREHNEPLDAVIYCEVMFDKDLSGEIPEHRDFIYNTAIPKIEQWGIPVHVVRSDVTFMDVFYHVRIRGNHIGQRVGFPMIGRCELNKPCKTIPIKRFLKKNITEDFMQYVGIAADEPKRLARLDDKHISLLDKYKVTEAMTYDIDRQYGLLSPAYDFTTRTGCFFCPNGKDSALKNLYSYHRDLWDKLMALHYEPNIIKRSLRINESLPDMEERFYLEGQQICLQDIGGC